MRTLTLRLTFLAGLLLPTRPVSAQLATQLAAELEQSLTSFQAQTRVHGLSAAILFPDQSVWTSAAGMASRTDSLRPGTLLGAGSITKTFTAALVLRLVARGQVQLDDSIVRYVPLVRQYPNINSGVTVRQLLSHTSGVHNYTTSADFLTAITTADPTRVFTAAEILGWVGPMRATPGTRWEYSNTGYTLLGLLVEHVTGKSLEQSLREELLDPLNLRSTWQGFGDNLPPSLTVSDGWIQQVANGPFVVNLGDYSRNAFFSSAYGAGELLSTPRELVQWAKALYGSTTVLDSASRALMTTATPLSTAAGLPYGLGAMRTTRSQRVMWGHNGSIPGYMATMGYVPSCGVAVAVMVNESNPVTEAAVNRLFAIVNRNVCNMLAVDAETELPAPRFYPNPAHGHTTLSYHCPPGTRRAQLEILDALGRAVRTLPLTATATEAPLDLTGLPAGLYTCRVRLDERAGPTVRLAVRP